MCIVSIVPRSPLHENGPKFCTNSNFTQLFHLLVRRGVLYCLCLPLIILPSVAPKIKLDHASQHQIRHHSRRSCQEPIAVRLVLKHLLCTCVIILVGNLYSYITSSGNVLVVHEIENGVQSENKSEFRCQYVPCWSRIPTQTRMPPPRGCSSTSPYTSSLQGSWLQASQSAA